MSCAHHKYGICALGKARPEEIPQACGTCPFLTKRPPRGTPRADDGQDGARGVRVRRVCVECNRKREGLRDQMVRRVTGEGGNL